MATSVTAGAKHQVSSYDLVPYPSNPFPQTHPDRLATIGMLFGLKPQPVNECRVLEIGCASGGNLIPLAEQLPGSRFIGIDLSGVQIREGQAFVQRAGLKNVELRQMDIMDVDAAFGEFDYIICHGIYSWVSRSVQDRILEIYAAHLAPQGIGYISYNTYPGWHMRGMIRDMMCYHTRRFTDVTTRIQQARALLDFLAQNTPEDNAYGMIFKGELGVLRNHTDAYLFHEHLEVVNDPIYFFQFAERAQAKGLQYLGEANVSAMYTGHLARHVADALERVASDLVQMEQYMDFVRNRLFRQTLLCHQGVPIDRELKPAALGPFHIASPLVPVDLKADVRSPEPLKFQHPASQQEVTTAVPLMKAAMICLAEAWPASLPFPKLLSMACSRVSSNPVSSTASRKQDAHFLGKSLLECYVSDMVELHSQPPSFTTQVSDRPLGSRVARVQIDSNAKYVTNLRHESGALSDGYRHVLRQLDGTRDRAELGDIFRKLVRDQILVLPETTTSEDLPTRLDRALDLTLYYLACNALLCTNPPGAASSETIVGAGLEVQQRR